MVIQIIVYFLLCIINYFYLTSYNDDVIVYSQINIQIKFVNQVYRNLEIFMYKEYTSPRYLFIFVYFREISKLSSSIKFRFFRVMAKS